MKKLIQMTALVMALLMLCACSNFSDYMTEVLHRNDKEEEAEPTETEAEPVETVSLQTVTDKVFGLVWDEAASFNPLTSLSLDNQNLTYLVYEGLFQLNRELEAEPVLCSGFEVSDDLTIYTIHLQEGVKFHNGTDLTADDVVYSINQACVNETSVYNSRFHAINSVFKVDDYTVEIDLGSPYEQFQMILDLPIIPEGTIDQARPSGTGPYSLTVKNGEALLSGFGNWWQNKALPVDVIYLHNEESIDQLRDDFETSRVDLLSLDPTGSTAISFHNDYELFTCGTTILQYVGFNFYSEMFEYEGARKAVCYAVDRDAIVSEIYDGKADAAVLPCRRESRLFDDSLAKKYAFDESMIKTCLEESGFETMDGGTVMYMETSEGMKPLNVDFIVNSENSYKVETAEKIKEMLERNGFVVGLRTLSYDDYLTALNTGDFDMYLAEVKLSPDFDLTSILNYTGYLNYGGATSDELNATVRSSLENSGAALDMFAAIYEHGLITPVLFKQHCVVAPRGLITNISPTVTNCFYGLTDWIIDLDA